MGVSTTNKEWPQIEERVALMPGNHHQHRHHTHHHHLHGAATGAINSVSATAATAAGRAMENQQALKCPRCDSSNTKFCYYNNYSLSQPRHFCKACKRYWTRGGTLRNVPVGGGCRKNKRIKKPSSSFSAAAHASAISDPPSLPLQISNLSLPQSSTTAIDPAFYGFHNNSTDLNLPANFPSFLKRLEQRNVLSNLSSCTDHYDLNPHLSSLGLCFPMNTTTTTTTDTHQDYNTVQYHTPDSAAMAASTASTSLVHDYSLLGSSLSSSTAASLLAASLRQPKIGASNSSGWPTPYDDIQVAMAGGSLGLYKEIKEEDGSNVVNQSGRLEWQIPCENPLENISAVDGASLYWNVNAAAIGGGWPEAATNCGSSVTPLI